MTRNQDDFPVQHIVPNGRHNAVGVRWWRNFYRDITATIAQAVAAALAAAGAQATANGAVTDAADAKQCAEDAQADINQHKTVQAGTSVLGHVTQAGPATPAATAQVVPSGLAYSQAYADQQTDRANDAHDRIDDLIAKLQASGVIQ